MAKGSIVIQLNRTDSQDNHFKDLVRLLDADLAERDGKDHSFYARYNKISLIKNVVIAYKDSQAVGCGAFKEFAPSIVEIKRMYTLPEHRGKGIARAILYELENWARDLGYEQCILETGKRQPEAIYLYQKAGYTSTANYGQYVGIDNSVCFSKQIATL
jgi:GNAT superfamily N-acetyltransferase